MLLFINTIEPDEKTPLMKHTKTAEQGEITGNGDNNTQDFKENFNNFYNLFFKLFYVFCFLTGQLPIKKFSPDDEVRSYKRLSYYTGMIVSTLAMILFTMVNIFSVIFNLYIIIWCPYKYCGYISVVFNRTNWLNVTDAQNISNSSEFQVVQPAMLSIFDDWKKTVFTTATFSGTISFLFMISVLYSQYSYMKLCCDGISSKWNKMWRRCGENMEDKTPGVLLSPFNDDTSREATRLAPKQAAYFMFIFLMNFLVFVANVALFFIIFVQIVNKNRRGRMIFDASGLASQFVSQLCAIFSCFIFSKLAYSVGTTCTHELPKLYKKVAQSAEIVMQQNEQGDAIYVIDENLRYLKDKAYINDEDIKKISRLHFLKAIALWYSKMLHTTLHPFGTWFAVHWVLYTVAAFMSISYLAETIILELYGQENKTCHAEPSAYCRVKLAYAFMFAIEHCILFLYPCFRAASVTTAYTSMIKKVSKAEWINITLDDKEKFINYLKIQDCTFKISILCAKLSFGFYIAYFSIFVGIFGVILKLAL